MERIISNIILDNKRRKARATVGLLVEDSQLVHLRNLKTAGEYWKVLIKVQL